MALKSDAASALSAVLSRVGGANGAFVDDPVAASELREASAEEAVSRATRDILSSLMSGRAEGRVCAVDVARVDTSNLERAVAAASSLAARSPSLEALRSGGARMLALRTAARRGSWGEVYDLLLLVDVRSLAAAARAEATLLRDESNSRRVIALCGTALGSGAIGGAASRLDVSAVDTANLDVAARSAKAVGGGSVLASSPAARAAVGLLGRVRSMRAAAIDDDWSALERCVDDIDAFASSTMSSDATEGGSSGEADSAACVALSVRAALGLAGAEIRLVREALEHRRVAQGLRNAIVLGTVQGFGSDDASGRVRVVGPSGDTRQLEDMLEVAESSGLSSVELLQLCHTGRLALRLRRAVRDGAWRVVTMVATEALPGGTVADVSHSIADFARPEFDAARREVRRCCASDDHGALMCARRLPFVRRSRRSERHWAREDSAVRSGHLILRSLTWPLLMPLWQRLLHCHGPCPQRSHA